MNSHLQPQLRYPIVLSIFAALLTMGIKMAAYWFTDSVSLLSDAVESFANLLAATVALLCLWYAARPVDTNHTYGHEKIEYFSSGLEGALILVAAGSIAWYAINRFMVLEPIQALGLGGALSLGAALINLVVAQILLRVGRAHGSIILEADGQHLMTDVWTTAGVLLGLFLVWLTNWLVLDPLIALIMAGNIAFTAFKLLHRSFNGLMDHALPPAEQDQVRSAIAALLPSGLHFHALRTRQAGTRRFVDFHLLVPGAWSVQKAHDLTGQIEKTLHTTLANLEITVHIEPLEEKASWEDSALLPLEKFPPGE